jgi:hypothetical protein
MINLVCIVVLLCASGSVSFRFHPAFAIRRINAVSALSPASDSLRIENVHIFNTLSKKKELFCPEKAPNVSFYRFVSFCFFCSLQHLI